ncbi:hypothetical protein FA95DRAFT_1386093 [Auriscalpium vulgare]|uniref:Uncharacterized protein n=1 Tax=Auriscalpium vulgare TaxID=40419 RepID=A0ACB8S8T8_9AGAM|nr:hypothetical protein FA95DRAFT_1386093 [Auriscalpium vulgare]
MIPSHCQTPLTHGCDSCNTRLFAMGIEDTRRTVASHKTLRVALTCPPALFLDGGPPTKSSVGQMSARLVQLTTLTRRGRQAAALLIGWWMAGATIIDAQGEPGHSKGVRSPHRTQILLFLATDILKAVMFGLRVCVWRSALRRDDH